jgi:hypothetical protein
VETASLDFFGKKEKKTIPDMKIVQKNSSKAMGLDQITVFCRR